MRQLAEQTKAKEAQQVVEQHQPIAIAIPDPTPEATPVHTETIAPDTTVKFFPARKKRAARSAKTADAGEGHQFAQPGFCTAERVETGLAAGRRQGRD